MSACEIPTRYPTIAMLKAFTAAARLGSFNRAGATLNVTQGAVSYQVRMLEQQLRVQLFQRLPSGLVLTTRGKGLACALVHVFDALDGALEGLRPSSRRTKAFSLTIPSSLALKWFIPRFTEFTHLNNGIEAKISIDDNPTDFLNGDFDVGIRYGNGEWPGLDATPILREEIFPVCSPAFLKTQKIGSLDDLACCKLLYRNGQNTFADGPDWEVWFRRAGRPLPLATTHGMSPYSTSCSHALLGLQSAIDARGVGLTRTLLCADDIAQGRLVRPVNTSIRADFSFYLVRPAGRPIGAEISAFSAWLSSAARATSDFFSSNACLAAHNRDWQPRQEQLRVAT
jgi:LysR family glycine cleavage system transcriptional activator